MAATRGSAPFRGLVGAPQNLPRAVARQPVTPTPAEPRHSSLDVTSNVYGHFEKATRKREAEAMAGVFGV